MGKGLTETMKQVTIYLADDGQRVPYVFTYQGRPIGSIQRAFETACRQVWLTGATFHDLRHTFVTNMRRAGVDYFRIMAITGHRTMEVFRDYNTIDDADLTHAVAQLDTYMDTKAPATAEPPSKSLKN